MEHDRAKELMLNGLTPSQLEAAEALLGNDNVFLTGDAGTGKSFLLDRYIEFLDRINMPHLVMAPTGVAALNVRGGVTMHRALQVPFGVVPPDAAQKRGIPRVLRAAEVVIVDEISMCRVDVFEYLMRLVARSEGDGSRVKVVLCGDFYQLPPVITPKELEAYTGLFPGNPHGWPFKSVFWRGRDFRPCVLTDVVRQDDPEFIDMLDRARRGDGSCVPYFNKRARSSRKVALNASGGKAIFLCSRNREAYELNRQKLLELGQPVKTYYADVRGNVNKGDHIAEDVLELSVGARVMAIANYVKPKKEDAEAEDGEDDRLLYVNGSRGTVVGLRPDSVCVEFDHLPDEVVEIEARKWSVNKSVAVDKLDDDGDPITTVELEEIGSITQIPLKLAYAVTIHKSQGMTFDSCVVNSTVFAAGQLYVGLSRCRAVDGLTIYPKIEDRRLISSDEVNEFYDSLGAWRPHAGQPALFEASNEAATAKAVAPAPIGPRAVPDKPDMVDLRLPAAYAAQAWRVAVENWAAFQAQGLIPAGMPCPANGVQARS